MSRLEKSRLLDGKERAAILAANSKFGQSFTWAAAVLALVVLSWQAGQHRRPAAEIERLPVMPHRDSNMTSMDVQREGTRRKVIPSAQEKEWAADCERKCSAAGFCCNNYEIGANQFLSCAQGCMIRKRGASADSCRVSCLHRGCHYGVGGHSYFSCGVCKDLKPTCPYGVMSQLPCAHGCGLVDWCWSMQEGVTAPGVLGPDMTLAEAQATCLLQKEACGSVTCSGATCSTRTGSALQPAAGQNSYVPVLCASMRELDNGTSPDLFDVLDTPY